MILRPINLPGAHRERCVPAWTAVEETQRRVATEYWLISQPDHAALAGVFARAIAADWIPQLSDDVVRAITLHDEGWRQFDAQPLARNGQPLSFIEVAPAQFVQAWTGSIERAEASSR